MLATRPATLVDVISTRSDAGTSLVTRAVAVLFFAALTAAAAQISVPLPFTQVPFTFQPTVVLLSGLVLGPRLGAASQVLYLAAGIAGLPVFAASATLPPGVWRLSAPPVGT
jgi:biotin transport system substrate-specific component